jgi:MOSC domain-containing protein YiiM
LAVGSAIIQVTDQPHTGCAKFVQRFGPAALRWVNTQKGLNFRGINAKVIQSGTIRQGDIVKRLRGAEA